MASVSSNQITLQQFRAALMPATAENPWPESSFQSYVNEINKSPSLGGFRDALVLGSVNGKIAFSTNLTIGKETISKSGEALTGYVDGKLVAYFGNTPSAPPTALKFAATIGNEFFHLTTREVFERERTGALNRELISVPTNASGALIAGPELAKALGNARIAIHRLNVLEESASELREVAVRLDQFKNALTQTDRDAVLASIGALGSPRRNLFDSVRAIEQNRTLSEAEKIDATSDLSFNLMKVNPDYTKFLLEKTEARLTVGFGSTTALTKAQEDALQSVNRRIEDSLSETVVNENGSVVSTYATAPNEWQSFTYRDDGTVVKVDTISISDTGSVTGVTRSPDGTLLSESTFVVNDDGSKIENVTFVGGGSAVRVYDNTRRLYSTETEANIENQRVVSTVYTDGRSEDRVYVAGQLVATSSTSAISDNSVVRQSSDSNGEILTTTNVQVLPNGSRVEVIAQRDGTTLTSNFDSTGSLQGTVTSSVSGIVTNSIIRDGAGAVVRTDSTQNFDGNLKLIDTGFADGGSVRSYGDYTGVNSDPANGPIVAPTFYSVTGTAPPLEALGTYLTDVNNVVQSIKNGNYTGAATSGLNLVNRQANPIVGGTQTVNNVPIFTTAAVVGALGSVYALHEAFGSGGNELGKFAAAANAVVAINAAINAVSNAVNSTVNAVASVALNGAAQAIGQVLPFVNAALAIQRGDYTGAAVAVVAYFVPVVGWIYAAYSIISAIAIDEPEGWAVAKVRFAENGGTTTDVAVEGRGAGPDKVNLLFKGNGKPESDPNYFGGLIGYLNAVIDAQRQANPNVLLGIIPQRMPTLSWGEARYADVGYSIVDIDPTTGAELLPSLRYNDNFLPYNADATDLSQRRNILERLVDSALARQAIAPMWEVQTARMQQDGGDPNAGLSEEERAGKRGQSAPADAQGKRLPGVFRPVALDLNGDNTITTVSDANSNVQFDWNDSGFKAETGWIGSGDGLLVIDRNSNGIADSGRELFSNGAVSNSARGVASMGWIDANADGSIDASDPAFNALRVWQDGNSNGVQDTNETKTLAELGITKLNYTQSRFTRNGADFALQSPDIEASSVGVRENVVIGGIQVTHSNGQSVLQVTSAQVTNTGGGTGQGTTFTVSNEAVASFEDGISPPNNGVSFSQDPGARAPIEISFDVLLTNDRFNNTSTGLTITALSNAQRGVVELDTVARVVRFTAEQNYNGQAGFDYTVTAPDGQIRTGQTVLNLAPVNDSSTVTSQLNQRPVYGYGVLVTTTGVGPLDDQRLIYTINPNQGEPQYDPYNSVGGREVLQGLSGPDGTVIFVEIGPVVDTGLQRTYFDAEWLRVQGQGNGNPDYTPPSFIEVVSGGKTYRIAGNPQNFYHGTPIGDEISNDGQVVVSDVDGPGQYSYSIATNGTYGQAVISNPAVGAFQYTGNRYVGTDASGVFVNANRLTDAHTLSEAVPAFYDTFDIKVVDLSDTTGNTFKIQTITVPHFGPRPLPDVASGGKPIAIDLNGNGFEFINVDDSNVFLDVRGDGINRRTSWVGPNDGMLAFDENANGKIEVNEISFSRFVSGAQTDLQGLRAFDTNNDGVFSAADAKWGSFGVWRDANSNGVNDVGEFQSLTAMGIQSVALTANGQFQVINGQTVHGTGVITRTDGTTLAMADVTLSNNNTVQAPATNGTVVNVPVAAFSTGEQFTGTAGRDIVFGTNGNDVHQMGDGADEIVDDLGDDVVVAGAGDDFVSTGRDNDYIDAGAGNDSVFAGAGTDLVLAGEGDDVVFLDAGNDAAFGGAGNDMISGGSGNDLISGDQGDDKLFGESGRDQLFGQIGDDEIFGMNGDDVLGGGAGNDLLVGGEGADQMEGGTGNDTYEIDDILDVVVEAATEGEDTVRSSINYTLQENFEHLTLFGTTAIEGTGNSVRNVMVGNSIANTLRGLGGDDFIDGGEGTDTLIGGQGDDTYVVDNAGDQVVEIAGEGTDTVQSRINYTLTANVENLSLIGIAAINGTGNTLNNGLTGNDAANVLDGGVGADVMRGGKGNDSYSVDNVSDQVIESADEGFDTVTVDGLTTYTLTNHVEALTLGAGSINAIGNALNNTLRGNSAANLLDGQAGADVMFGGAGDDVYIVDEQSDIAVEKLNEGFDTVRSSVTYSLSANVEALELTGAGNNNATGNALANTLTGNGGNNRLDGGLGADTMVGGLGDDTYFVDNAGDLVIEEVAGGVDTIATSLANYTLTNNIENLTALDVGAVNFTGNAAINTLRGNAGNDLLDGAAGADVLFGGKGDDTYIVDDAGDVVTELVAEGNDAVNAAVSFILGSNLENLVLSGGVAINATGNELDNLLTGNAANNVLDGGAGADSMAGAGGSDTYIVDNVSDSVTENLNEGQDRIQSSVSYTLLTNVEELELTGTANINATGNVSANILLGNDGSNVLDGGAGADSMTGGLGDDTYVVDNIGDQLIESVAAGTDTVNTSLTSYTLGSNLENLTALNVFATNLTGNSAINVLQGNIGNDVLDGGVGADTLIGSMGDDIYIVDNAADNVTEVLNEGQDRIRSSVTYTLPTNVEEIELTGTANINAAGNSDANILLGNSGNNLLDGGAGADSMTGGWGDDTYVVDNIDDQVMEGAAAGTDTVNTSFVNYTLASNVENLNALDVLAVNFVGNASGNILRGNLGNDLLDGAAGADTLIGGKGDDTYVVDNSGDVITENALEGFDRVISSIDYVLPQNVEQVTLTGTAIRATGNQLDNLLFGNAQANILDGGLGADQLSGGLGDDRYAVDNVGDVATESLNEGNDTVVSAVSYTLATNIENLVLNGTQALNGFGNGLANVLVGNTGANTLDGGAGNDVLAGGQGNDNLIGGAGDDLYLYNQGEGHDVISDVSGIDTLRFGPGLTLDSISARTVAVNGQSKLVVTILGADGQETADGIEWLLGTGGVSPIERFEFANGTVATLAQISVAAKTLNGSWTNDTLTGDRSDDLISGGAGNDIIYGRTGNDTLNGDSGIDKLFGEGGNDKLYGGSENDALWGGAGSDILDGGSGADQLSGGTGDDKLYGGVDADVLDAGAGNDQLFGDSGADQLFGGAGNDVLDSGVDADLIAAGDGDDTITSGSGSDVVVAGFGNDVINTDVDKDFIDAGAGIDTITAGSGVDFIAGGTGNDTIDAGQDQDVIAFNRGDGADTLLTSSWQRDTLSLGGGIKYADLTLSKVGSNLVLNLGQGDSVTFKDWYLDSSRRNLTTLQVVTAAVGGDYSAASTDRMKNKGVVSFNFETLAAKFDQVRAANPMLASWSLGTELNAVYVSGSNTTAIGGDLSYRYGTTGSYGDLDWAGVKTRMQGLGGTSQQAIMATTTATTTVNPWIALQAGISLIADQSVGLPSPLTVVPSPTQDELVFAAIGASGQTTSWRGQTASPVLP